MSAGLPFNPASVSQGISQGQSLLNQAQGFYNRGSNASSASRNPVAQSSKLYSSRGGASKFDSGKYDIKEYTYPTNLMTEEYGGNYVVFYINVSSASKLVNGPNAAATVELSPNEGRDRGDLIAQNLSKKQLVGSAASINTITGLVGGSIALKGNTVGEQVTNALTGAAVANIATVGTGIATTMAPSATREQKRLKTAIALHTPTQLGIRYSVNWSDEDTFAIAAASTGIDEIVRAVSSKGKNSDVTGVAQSVITNLSLANDPNKGAYSAALGIQANPKKEQVFKGVDFRTFSFEYQFFPKNETEARNVKNIIDEFKYHMHPEFMDTNNFVYLYPSEFDIYYYQGEKENLNIHRHTSCVLTEINVNYTPNGSFSTFPDGMPTQINMSLTFRELALLTKDKIKDGL